MFSQGTIRHPAIVSFTTVFRNFRYPRMSLCPQSVKLGVGFRL